MVKGGGIRRKRRSMQASIKGTETGDLESRVAAAAELHDMIASDRTGPKTVSQIVSSGGVEALAYVARNGDDDAAAVALDDLVALIVKGDKHNAKAVVKDGGAAVLVAVASSPAGTKAKAAAERGLALETYEEDRRKYVARGIDAARAEAETAPPATKRGSFFDTVDEHDDEHDVDDGDDDGAPPRTGAPEESQ